MNRVFFVFCVHTLMYSNIIAVMKTRIESNDGMDGMEKDGENEYMTQKSREMILYRRRNDIV